MNYVNICLKPMSQCCTGGRMGNQGTTSSTWSHPPNNRPHCNKFKKKRSRREEWAEGPRWISPLLEAAHLSCCSCGLFLIFFCYNPSNHIDLMCWGRAHRKHLLEMRCFHLVAETGCGSLMFLAGGLTDYLELITARGSLPHDTHVDACGSHRNRLLARIRPHLPIVPVRLVWAIRPGCST